MKLFNQIKYKLEQELLNYSTRDWIYLLLLVLVTILIGSVAVNYMLDMLHNINTAVDPCGVCRKLNPDIEIVKRYITIDWNSNITITP